MNLNARVERAQRVAEVLAQRRAVEARVDSMVVQKQRAADRPRSGVIRDG